MEQAVKGLSVVSNKSNKQHIYMCVNIGSQSTAPPRISASMSQATLPPAIGSTSPPLGSPLCRPSGLPGVHRIKMSGISRITESVEHRQPASQYRRPFMSPARTTTWLPVSGAVGVSRASTQPQTCSAFSIPRPLTASAPKADVFLGNSASSIDAMSDVCLPRETHDIDPSSPRAHAFTYAVLAADRPSGSSSFCLFILSCPSPYLPFCGASQTPRYRSSHLAPFGARHIATGTPRDAPSCFGGPRIRWPSPLAPAPIPILNLPYPPPPLQARTEHRRSRTPDLDSLPWSPSRVQCHPG